MLCIFYFAFNFNIITLKKYYPIKITIISEIFEYEGEVIWDTSKSDGQKIKIFDTKKLNELGLYCSTPLKEGLKKTIDWYKLNYKIKGNIRL